MSTYQEPPVYALRNAHLHFGPKMLFQGVELYIKSTDKICLIGRNGSGKSTLLKVIAGLQEVDEGDIFIQPAIKIAYMPQEADFSAFSTLKDAVLSVIHSETEKYKAESLMMQFKLQGEQNPKTASGGERKKVSLIQALINQPDILLLDEPTNHLDIETVEKLEKLIKNYAGAVVVISHDRAFLKAISRSMWWLDRGVLRTNDKGYAHFENWQEQVLEQEIIEQKKLNKKISEETEWLHKGVTARRKRNMGRLHRLLALREERKNQIQRQGSARLEVDKGDIKTKMIVEAKHIHKAFDEKTIVSDFSIRIIRGNKIGIVGANGVGKTTLIKLLTKRLAPDSGFVRLAKNLEEAYFDQNRIQLDPNKTLWATLCPQGDYITVRGQVRHVVSYLKDFLFTPAQAKSFVGSLSGGEKNRLMLAITLAKPSNFLVLDEPTNDLDMDTLDLLQDMLEDYAGTALIISHDRDFLDKTTTSLLYMDGSGQVVEYVGAYSELLDWLKPQKKIIKEVKKTVQPVKEKTNKITFKEQYLLQQLPDEIAGLETRIKELEDSLSNPHLYQTEPALFDSCARELETLKKRLEEKETLWLELQIKSES